LFSQSFYPKTGGHLQVKPEVMLLGNAPWLKTVLIQCAWAGARKKGSYLEAQFHRSRARRGAKKAVGAVAASILTAAYHMIANGTFYQDLDADHFVRRAKPNRIKRLVAKIQSLGYEVEIKPSAT
jgi:hypothetical protein